VVEKDAGIEKVSRNVVDSLWVTLNKFILILDVEVYLFGVGIVDESKKITFIELGLLFFDTVLFVIILQHVFNRAG
jgi:hypothetical protein